jgi:3-oxoacyl-[acyl-carrier-protein] synthase-3
MSKKVGIAAIGSYVPEQILSNADLEKMVETTDEWITTRTGIKERRLAGEGVYSSDLATEAARDCLAQTGLTPDLLISSCATTEYKLPYQASIVANRMGLSGLPAFDLNVACSGMVYSMAVAYSMIQAGPYRNGLVTAAEKMSNFVDYKDRSSCILFGDGGSALLLSAENPEHEILSFELGTDAAGHKSVIMGGPGPEHFFWQDGKNLFKFAANKMAELVRILKERTGHPDNHRLHVIPHQANIRIIEAAIERTGVPAERFVGNIEKYGNTSSASIGLAFKEAALEGRFEKGDIIFLIGFGAGLSWAGTAVRW